MRHVKKDDLMGLFDFLRRKPKSQPEQISVEEKQMNIDRSEWTGKDFEFLITGNIEVSDFDNIMTPNTFPWTKKIKENWNFYQVGQDEFSYSIEPPGIQMTFNKEMSFNKAKRIADEVVNNIIATGQEAELIILNRNDVYRFD